MSDTYYVSGLNLRDRRRKPIEAGTRFRKSALDVNTFDSLLDNGDISEDIIGKPITVVELTKGKALASGPKNLTPSAAINPKSKTIEELTDAQYDEQEVILVKLKKLGINPAYNCKLATLQKKLKAAIKANKEVDKIVKSIEKSVSKSKVESVWDGDPKELENIDYPRLLAMYKDTCIRYGQDIESFDSKELLIEKMSSEFTG